MNVEKNQKALFLLDVEHELEPILQEVTNIRPENMLTIQSYGPVISNPYGDIMRSVIISIYEENVADIYVVGKSRTNKFNENLFEKDKIQTIDYLFQNSKPEFAVNTFKEWLNGKGNGMDNVKDSVHIIRHHPLVPAHVNVRGLVVNNKDEQLLISEIPTNNVESNVTGGY